MKRRIKKIVVIGLIVFLLIQLYQPARNKDNGQVLPIHFTKVYNLPPNVLSIFTTSCFDCHSNNTQYPWYSYIQPLRFFMEGHIKNGKENLNFSEWGNYSNRKQNNKLDRIAKQIKTDEMPLPSYILIHRYAKLSMAQKKEIVDWIDNIKK